MRAKGSGSRVKGLRFRGLERKILNMRIHSLLCPFLLHFLRRCVGFAAKVHKNAHGSCKSVNWSYGGWREICAAPDLQYGGFPKIRGIILEVPKIRVIVYKGLLGSPVKEFTHLTLNPI